MKIMVLIRETLSHWQQKNASRMGAALSYYTIFSLAPLLVLLLSLAGFFFSRTEILENLTTFLQQSVGATTGNYILGFTTDISTSTLGFWGTLVSALILIFSAIGVINELNSDLDEIWQLPVELTNESFFQKVRKNVLQRITSFSLIPITALVFITAVSISIILHSVGNLTLISNAISFIVSIILFTLIFRILPNTKLPWKELICGAMVTAVLFFIGKIFISLYINLVAHLSLYGAAGSLIALLIWVYYCAQIFFIGASFIFVYSKRYGSLAAFENKVSVNKIT